MMYDVIKCLHILSASLVLCGNGFLGMMLKIQVHANASPKKLRPLFEKATTATLIITIPFGALQAISGFELISLKHMPFTLPWLYVPILCFLASALLWCLILYYHLACQEALTQGAGVQDAAFKKPFTRAWILGWFCLLLILMAIFAMSNLSLHWPNY